MHTCPLQDLLCAFIADAAGFKYIRKTSARIAIHVNMDWSRRAHPPGRHFPRNQFSDRICATPPTLVVLVYLLMRSHIESSVRPAYLIITLDNSSTILTTASPARTTIHLMVQRSRLVGHYVWTTAGPFIGSTALGGSCAQFLTNSATQAPLRQPQSPCLLQTCGLNDIKTRYNTTQANRRGSDASLVALQGILPIWHVTGFTSLQMYSITKHIRDTNTTTPTTSPRLQLTRCAKDMNAMLRHSSIPTIL